MPTSRFFRTSVQNYAADLAAAQEQNILSHSSKKHVKILAGVDNCNALLLLAVYKRSYISVGRIDVPVRETA